MKHFIKVLLCCICLHVEAYAQKNLRNNIYGEALGFAGYYSVNYERFQPLLDVLMRMPGTRFPEHKMALTIDKQPCGFDDADYWVRGIADLLIIDGDHAFVIDYKTGKPKMPDPDQLKLMALMVLVVWMRYSRLPSLMVESPARSASASTQMNELRRCVEAEDMR
jgi:hypothetical protein